MAKPETVVLVGLRYDVFYAHTLAIGYLKAYADSQPDLAARYRSVLVERTVHEPLAEQAAEILGHDPKIVAFSCYLWNFTRVAELCRALKAELPRLRIILGGPEVSVRGPSVLSEIPEADVVVQGEGELTFAAVLRAWAGGKGLDGVLGTIHRRRGETVSNPERPLIQDLSIIPSPFLTGLMPVSPGERIALETSRGCPLQCRFCDWQNYQATRWFPAERAIKEAALIHRQSSGIFIFVTDADIFTNKKRAALLLRGWDKVTGNEGVHWHMQTDLAHIDEDLAKLLDSYKFSLGSGIESIQPHVLKRMVRGFSRRGVERSIGHLKRHAPAVGVHLQLISGLPADDMAGYRRSLEWALSWKTDGMFLPHALALPGAEFGRHPERYGIKRVMPEPPYFVLDTDTFSADAIVEADRLAFRVLNTHKEGLFRRVLETIGPDEKPASPEAAAATPWVDLYERFHAYATRTTDFFKRAADWYEKGNALSKVMDQEPIAFMHLPPAERINTAVGLATFAREELGRAGRSELWPDVEHLLRSFEAGCLWETALTTPAFDRLFKKLLNDLPVDSGGLRFAGWEGTSSECGIFHRARQIHVISPAHGARYEVCPATNSLHVHIEDQNRPERWEALFPERDRAFTATILSNVYWAVPPALRVPVLRWIRERNPNPDGRLLLVADDVGLARLEFLERPGGAPPAPPAVLADVRSDLEAAGWALADEPRALSAPGQLSPRVRWTFFSAVPARTAAAREMVAAAAGAGERFPAAGGPG